MKDECVNLSLLDVGVQKEFVSIFVVRKKEFIVQRVQQFPIDDVDESEDFSYIADDPVGIERFILQIENPHIVEILTLRALGFKYFEIVTMMRINTNQYYLLLHQLRIEVERSLLDQ